MHSKFVFSPEGNLNQETNLQQLSPVRTVVKGGRAFTEIRGGDAAMSHRLQFTLDSTWHSGECFVFEQDEATLAPFVQEGKRVLTAREEAALQHHLQAIFDSVFQSVSRNPNQVN